MDTLSFRARVLCACLSLSLLLAGTARGQEDGKPYVLEDTVVHTVPATASKRDYEVFVRLPADYETSNRRYPVVFLTDTDYGFPLVRSIARRVGNSGNNIEDFILVGLSYAKHDTPIYSRNRDYTPTDVIKKGTKNINQDGLKYGDAEMYRRYIADDVFPFVAKHYRADMSRKVYVGHSYGGLFGAHVLLTEPGMFQHYILSSPSLWFDRKIMLDVEREYARRHKDLNAKVFMATGSFETIKPGSHEKRYNEENDLVDDMLVFEKRLRSRHYPNLQIYAKVIDDEDHLTVFPSVISRGLVWALPGKNLWGE